MLKQLLVRYQLPIVAGILIGTSYIPFPPWASLFAFVPLWIFLQKQTSWKTVLTGSFITGFLLTLIGFNWVAFTMKEFGHMPWPFAILALIGFCAFANLDIAAASLAWYYLKKKMNLSPLVAVPLLGLLTALFERHFPTIFAWNYGFTFYWSGLPISQLAELVGFQGLSSFVIVANLASYAIWQNLGQPKAKKQLAAFVVGFLILNGAGWLLKSTVAQPDAQIRSLITQANIGNQEKQYAENGGRFREKIIERYVLLTRQAYLENKSGPVDFTVWPETAIPLELLKQEPREYEARPIVEMVRDSQVPLLSGGYGEDPVSGKVTNSFFIFEKDGRIQWPFYFKTILLVFGEYMPLSDRFPVMKTWFPTGDFAHGPGPQVKTVGSVVIGPQICYESLFPEFTRELVRKGAEIVVNVTNDSWYGEWQEPFQHGYMTLARSIEFRRPIIRSTNTGISTVALADGTVLEKGPLGAEWAHIFDIPYKKNPTLTIYAKFPWLVDTALIILIFILMWRGQIERNKKS